MKTTRVKDFSKEDRKCEPERPGSEPTDKTLIVTTAVMLGAVAVAVWMFKPTPEFHFTGTCPGTQNNEALDRYVGQWDGWWDDTWYMKLTVSRDPEVGGFRLQYEHEEKVGQLPLDIDVIPACLVNGALVDDGSRLTMRLSGSNDEAKLTGAFWKQARYTSLKRIMSTTAFAEVQNNHFFHSAR